MRKDASLLQSRLLFLFQPLMATDQTAGDMLLTGSSNEQNLCGQTRVQLVVAEPVLWPWTLNPGQSNV